VSVLACPEGLPRTPGPVEVGDLVVARAWKFNGAPHWVVPGYQLGSDEHGTWLYQPAGSLVSRPGRAHLAACEALCLVPRTGSWLATFFDNPGEDVDTYIDVSTRIGWQPLPTGGWEVNSIDMDLDVIRSHTRGVFLDDEDEFAQHSSSMGYPPSLQQQARQCAAELLELVASDAAPYHLDFRRQWLDQAVRLPAYQSTLRPSKDL